MSTKANASARDSRDWFLGACRLTSICADANHASSWPGTKRNPQLLENPCSQKPKKLENQERPHMKPQTLKETNVNSKPEPESPTP